MVLFRTKDKKSIACSYVFLKDSKEFIIHTAGKYEVSPGTSAYGQKTLKLLDIGQDMGIKIPIFLGMIQKRLERTSK